MSKYNLNVSYSGSASSLQLTSVDTKLAEEMTKLYLKLNGIRVVNFRLPYDYEELTLNGAIGNDGTKIIEVYLNAG